MIFTYNIFNDKTEIKYCIGTIEFVKKNKNTLI